MFGAIVAALAVVVVVTVSILGDEFKAAEVMATETTGYPLLRETQSSAQALLTRNEVVDAGQGVFRIPIERAMQLTVAESGPTATDQITLRR